MPIALDKNVILSPLAGGGESVADPHWYPPNNQNDGGPSGLEGAGMTLSLNFGFRMFGENISEETEVEVFNTSAPSGSDIAPVTTGGVALPSITTSFVAASGSGATFSPAYIEVSWDDPPDPAKIWAHGRNPGGNWVPYPVQFITGAG